VARVRSDLERANVKVSLKAEGAQIRAGVALFNNSDDIDALLRVTAGWIEARRILRRLTPLSMLTPLLHARGRTP
jgi:hypothetical protein